MKKFANSFLGKDVGGGCVRYNLSRMKQIECLGEEVIIRKNPHGRNARTHNRTEANT